MTKDNQELVVVYEAYDEVDAEIVKLALAEEGINSALENAHQAGFTGTFLVKLLVFDDEVQRAREFIRAHKSSRGNVIE